MCYKSTLRTIGVNLVLLFIHIFKDLSIFIAVILQVNSSGIVLKSAVRFCFLLFFFLADLSYVGFVLVGDVLGKQ